MKPRLAFFMIASVMAPAIIAGKGPTDLKPYPPPDQGVVRMVFRLPTLDNETDRKVEIIVGKTLQVDCNRTWYMGNLESRIAEGWGYPYSVLEKASGPATTMMACPPDVAHSEAFVQVRGEGFFQRYNSKLPIVTYVPEGFLVRYRIWTAGKEMRDATQE